WAGSRCASMIRNVSAKHFRIILWHSASFAHEVHVCRRDRPPAMGKAPMAPPVIAIDGPAASGKGTVAQGVAAALRLHYLDSGSLYRLVALKAAREGVPVTDAPRLAALARSLDVRFDQQRASLDGLDVTEELRGEPV